MMETQVLKVSPTNPEPGVIERAAEIIRTGGLVAFPTETVYGLGADAFDSRAVTQIYEVKGRPPANPLPVLVGSRDDVHHITVEVPEAAQRLVEAFLPGPLTIILRASSDLPEIITAGTGNVGVRMPDHPVALALIRATGRPIAATSANTSGQPAPTTADEVLAYLNGKIELVLDGGPTLLKVASTVVDATQTPPQVLREGSISRETLAPYLTDL